MAMDSANWILVASIMEYPASNPGLLVYVRLNFNIGLFALTYRTKWDVVHVF